MTTPHVKGAPPKRVLLSHYQDDDGRQYEQAFTPGAVALCKAYVQDSTDGAKYPAEVARAHYHLLTGPAELVYRNAAGVEQELEAKGA